MNSTTTMTKTKTTTMTRTTTATTKTTETIQTTATTETTGTATTTFEGERKKEKTTINKETVRLSVENAHMSLFGMLDVGVSLGLLAGFEAYVRVSFHLRC